MRFEQALEAMRKGKKVRRLKWQENEYLHLITTLCAEHDQPTEVRSFDIIREDWEIME